MSAEAGHVFISYVREDAEPVAQLKDWLEAAGIPVWIDKDDLWAGEDWRVKIRQAIEKDALVFVACFSRNSQARTRSYQYEELILAIEQMRVRRPGDPWLILVRLDECDIPDLDIGAGRRLGNLHRADLFGDSREENASRLITAVLRILGRAAVTVPFSATSHRHVAGSLARSLAGDQATRAQVLGFFGQPSPEIDRFWGGITDRVREDVLSLLLGELDGKAADALCAHWELLAEDTARYLGRLLGTGEADAAAWCLSVLGTARSAEVEDHLLSRLLVSRNSPANGAQRTSALVRLLRQRLAPRPGTFRHSCEAVRSGSEGGVAALVRSLLAGEMESAPGVARAADWVDWLCLTEFAEHEKQADWITALTSTRAGQVSDQSARCIRSLVRSDRDWAAVILRLAGHADCLPVIIEVSYMAPEDFLAYLKSSPLPGKNEWLRALIAKLGTRGLRAQKSQEFSAIVDIIRVVLGGRPTDFPLRHDGLSADRYIHALGDALHLEANTQERIRVQQHFLTHACGDDRLRSSGVRLLLAWSEDPDMAPGVVRFLGADPKERFLADVRLNARFWRVMASCKPALISKRTWPLRAAVQQAARSPGTAAGCIVSDGGVRGTVLAVAMYKASLEGITAGQIVNTLQARNGDGARIGSQLTPETLDCFLKEFQALLYHDSGITRDSSRDYLSDIYRRIARGALGSEYGARFRRYRARRLPVEKWLWVQSQVRSLFWQGQKKSG